MLRIDRNNHTLTALETSSLASALIKERYDLQEYICNSPTAFFKEIRQDLFLVGKELQPSHDVQDRIDLLAVDKKGVCVVIELKRGNHKLQMLQAISYAAMISSWSANDIISLLSKERQDDLYQFLDVEPDEINREQRIMLVAEAFDYALLIASEWLTEKYEMDVRCCRISMEKDTVSGAEYLVCSNVYPTPELVEEAVARRTDGRRPPSLKWSSWKQAIENITNKAVRDFFEKELHDGREEYLPKRTLFFRIGGRRRWFVRARQNLAYAWQYGRFENDIGFWTPLLCSEAQVEPIAQGRGLRFFLRGENDFVAFKKSADTTLHSANWEDASTDGDESDQSGPDSEI